MVLGLIILPAGNQGFSTARLEVSLRFFWWCRPSNQLIDAADAADVFILNRCFE